MKHFLFLSAILAGVAFAETVPPQPPVESLVTVKEYKLDPCYVLPALDEAKDVYDGGSSSWMRYGYKYVTRTLVIAFDYQGGKFYEKVVASGELKQWTTSSSWSSSLPKEEGKAQARKAVLAQHAEWYNPIRNFQCEPVKPKE